MTTIIKYSNRKLYNKETAKYINHTELLSLPMGSFRVISHGSFNDITINTLIAALLAGGGALPHVQFKVMRYCLNTLSQ